MKLKNSAIFAKGMGPGSMGMFSRKKLNLAHLKLYFGCFYIAYYIIMLYNIINS